MQTTLVGRRQELLRFEKMLAADQPCFAAIYGRRRVGKTFLVRQAFAKQLVFELVGTRDGKMGDQLNNFVTALRRASAGKFPRPDSLDSWSAAFQELSEWCDTLPRKPKMVLFFDELPWLASRRSGFMEALDHFWNSWGTRKQNLILVVCGSAAAWMIKHLVHNKGGLHNRVTHRFRLVPFDLAETREFLAGRRVRLTDYQIAELYMAIGGVPLYLEQAEAGESAAQIVDRICFSRDGFLREEFSQLYAALFDSPERHLAIVQALASKNRGLTRDEISAATGLSASGRLTQTLDELIESAFVRSDPPFDKKKKGTLYRLADEFSQFHLRWMADGRGAGQGVRRGGWAKRRGTPKWRAWAGTAFEMLCLKHTEQIKIALGIAGVETDEACWDYRTTDATESGAQIDLLIDRADACINLCEMKFSEAEFVISKSYAQRIRERNATFRRVSKTRKAIFTTWVTTHGVKPNAYAAELVDAEVTLAQLMEPCR